MRRLNKSTFLLLFLLPACSKQERIFKRVSLPFLGEKKYEEDISEKNPKAPNVTIWVHGTCLWPFRVFKKYWNKNPTLIKVSSLKKGYYLRKVAETLSRASSDYPLEDFYFLRWSGKLSVSEREEGASHLYGEIVKLLEKYKKAYETRPKLTVITHSHGGNVALNLSNIKDKDPEVKIDNLILLACPVQKHTRECVSDNMFGNVYSFYSSIDLIQVLDPQGLHYHRSCNCRKPKGEPIFSGRNFPSHSKLFNVKMKINGRGIWHNQFLSKEFIATLPQVINCLNEWRKKENNCNYFISVLLKKQTNSTQVKRNKKL